MEVVRYSPLTTFVNNDRYFKIEVDFDASLDEEFNVPTSKQRKRSTNDVLAER